MDASSCKLITASVDGLIAVHDVSKGLNEDDGFQVLQACCAADTTYLSIQHTSDCLGMMCAWRQLLFTTLVHHCMQHLCVQDHACPQGTVDT